MSRIKFCTYKFRLEVDKNDETKQLINFCKDQLLQGLNDSSEENR